MKLKLFVLTFLFSALSWGQAIENFENITTASSTTYLSRSWTGTDGVTWTATSARTDQTLTAKAICTNGSGTVTSPTYSGGMGVLTFDYVRGFTGTSARSLTVWVNGVQIGGTTTVNATSSTVQNYSATINVAGSVSLEIRTSGAQIVIDNISWTPYASCATPNPTGTITATQNCGNTSLTYSAPSASVYWQTSATGTDFTYATTVPYTATTNGTYYVRAYNGTCWSAGTVSLAVTVVNPVVILGHPSTTAQNLCQSAAATGLSVTASGSGLTYQWYSNTANSTVGGTLISGATSATYTPSTAVAGTLYYYCIVTGTCSAVTSNVSGAVNITALPGNPTGTVSVTQNCGNSQLTYSVPSASLYWQTTASGTDTTYPTTAAYTATTNGTYYVRAFNGTCWSAGTVSQAVTVVNPIAISSQPTNQSATSGNTATFSVTASNAAGYQWQINTGSGWSDIAGATTASYATPATTLAMNGYQYQVVITGNAPCGNVTSSAATLSVTTGPCFTDNYNSGYGTWSGGSGTYNNSTAGNTGNGVGFNDVNDDIITNVAITNPQSIQFQLASSSTSANKTISIEYATSATGPWTTVRNILNSEVSTSFTLFTTNLNLTGAYYLRIVMSSRTGGSYYLDNVDVFCQAISGPEINITGNGTNIADNDTTPAAIDGTNLGTVALSTNIIQTFTIQNIGTTNLVLSGPITLTDVSAPQEFVITQPAISIIPAGGSTTFTITFNSAVAGLFTNTVNINSNDTDEALYNFDIMASATAATGTGTVFRPGDLIFVGYDSTISAAADCSGLAQMDKLYIANLVDILPGTEFMVVNSRYESGAAANVRTDRWYSGSTDPYDDPGIITFKWNGAAPIVAGSIITFKANVFTVSDIRINDVVTTDFGVTTNANQCNISSSESDQIYIMQGTFTSFGTIGTNRYNIFNGNVLFGLTNGANWVPFTSGVSAANSSAGRVSRLPEDLECFNIESSSLEGVRFYRNSGLHTGSKNQILGAIMNLGNWSAPSNDNCLSTTENFSPSANDNAVGKPFTITPSNPDGTWTGFTDTDWFKCSNWEGLAVPKPITDVIIPNVVNQPIIGASPAKFPTGAFSNNLTVNNGSSLTMNNVLSRLNLYGNWTNDAGNAAFEEGNGTVHFTGTNPQIINNVTPLGTEVFYNVVLNNNFTTAVSNDLIASGNLTVNTGKIVEVSPDDYIQVNENLINNGTFTVFNNGSLIQVNDLGVNTGTITYQRTAMARNLDYVYWSSPVAAFNVNNLPNNYRYIWNTTIANTNGGQGNWVAASGNMIAGKGYIARASNGSATPIATTTSFVGVPNNGVVSMPIIRGSYQGDDYPGTNEITITRFSDNWNLVGNPYPSAINVDEFLDLNTNIEGAIRIWTHGTLPSASINNPFYGSYQANYTPDDYITHNGVGTDSGPVGFNGFLAGGQGFMVNMLDGAAGGDNLIFKNSLRNKSYNNSQFYRTSGVSNIASVEKNRIWLDLINNSNNAAKRTLIGYVGNATNDKDRLYDAFTSVGTTMHIYSIIANDKMTIQGRQLPFDANDKVNLGYFVPASGNYSIGIAALDGLFASGQNIYLEDKLLGIIHDLRSNPYSFSANAGEVNNRFVLRYTNETLGNDDFITTSDVLISSSDVISVNAMSRTIQNVKIYNVLGQLLLDADAVNSNTFETSKLQKNNTTLLVQVTLENGAKVTKKIVF